MEVDVSSNVSEEPFPSRGGALLLPPPSPPELTDALVDKRSGNALHLYTSKSGSLTSVPNFDGAFPINSASCASPQVPTSSMSEFPE